MTSRSIPFRLLAIVGFFAFPLGIHAETTQLPSGIFLMANGTYYQPSTNRTAATLQELVPEMTSDQNSTLNIKQRTTERNQGTPVLNAIASGRSALEEMIRKDEEGRTEPRTETSDEDFRTVTLAIWNPTASEESSIRYVTLLKKGTALRAISDSISGISVARSNGINSEYRVKGGEIVVAVRYPIYTEERKKTKKQPALFSVRDVVYTPYAKVLHTPEMVSEGKKWLDERMTVVFDTLRAEGRRSRAFPDRLLADVMDHEFARLILLVEHVDTGAVEDDPYRQLENVLVTLAANKETSYRYSKSTAGALGLAQFMPSTYKSLAAKIDQKLIPNFELGMGDPENAIRATVIYLDYLLASLPASARAAYATERWMAIEYVAAAYNAGPARVAKAMKVWEENFNKDDRPHILSRSRLKRETMEYVLKIRMFRAIFAAQKA